MKHLHTALETFALVLTLAVAAAAQSAAKTNVPFDFKVGDVTLKSGEYTIERVSDHQPELLALRDAAGDRKVVVNGIRLEYAGGDKGPRLVFTKSGDLYFLSQIWTSGYASGAEVRKGSLEKEMVAHRNDGPTTISLGN